MRVSYTLGGNKFFGLMEIIERVPPLAIVIKFSKNGLDIPLHVDENLEHYFFKGSKTNLPKLL